MTAPDTSPAVQGVTAEEVEAARESLRYQTPLVDIHPDFVRAALEAAAQVRAGQDGEVERLRRVNSRLRRRNARRRERIEHLVSDLALAEEDADRARGIAEDLQHNPWPKWADECLKIIRKHSGYDGYDDASEGVDLPSELEETLGEYRQQARRVAVEARVEWDTKRHRAEAEHHRNQTSSLCARITSAEARATAAEEANERLRSVLLDIDRWSRAYPLEVFPEADDAYLAKAHAVLQQHGMGVDRISASAMRHVVEGVGEIARRALASAEGGRDDGR